jgi:hypothetical protein
LQVQQNIFRKLYSGISKVQKQMFFSKINLQLPSIRNREDYIFSYVVSHSLNPTKRFLNFRLINLPPVYLPTHSDEPITVPQLRMMQHFIKLFITFFKLLEKKSKTTRDYLFINMIDLYTFYTRHASYIITYVFIQRLTISSSCTLHSTSTILLM